MKKLSKKGRYCLLIIFFLIIIPTGFLLFGKRDDPFAKYKDIAKENKQIGELEHMVEETEERRTFVHYPKLNHPKADEVIKQWIQKLPKDKAITYVDYESKEVFNAYWSIVFHVQQLDSDQKVIQSQDVTFNFDKESGKQLKIGDVLRRDYGDMLKEQFQKQADLKLTDVSKVSFIIGDDALLCRVDEKQITLPYDQFSKYMKVKGKGIVENEVSVKRSLTIDPDQKMIALTFDDGPSPYTEDFLTLLESHHANASFFMLGQNVAKYPDTVKHMIEGGFEICNHSWNHKSISSDDSKMIKQEIFDTQDALYRMSGHEPTRIRPPYGAWNDLTKQITSQNSMNITLWNVDSEDWKNRDAAVTFNRAKAGARDGAVILFHDLYPSTLDALKQLVPYLQNEGYQLVTVSQLFQYKGDLTGL